LCKAALVFGVELQSVSCRHKLTNINYLTSRCSAVSNNAVLTAAHCFDSTTNLTSMQVVVGEHNITGTRETRFTRSYGIRNVTVHDLYNSSIISENDIALVFTKTNILFDYGVSPSCLPFRWEIFIKWALKCETKKNDENYHVTVVQVNYDLIALETVDVFLDNF